MRGVVTLVVVASLLPARILVNQLSSPIDIPSYFTSSEVQKVPKGSIALVAPWTTDPSNVLPEVWQAARFITDLLGRPPEKVGGVYLWSRVGG